MVQFGNKIAEVINVMSLLRTQNLLKFARSISLRVSRMDQKQQAVQEVEQVLNDNPYYAKYKQKIDKLAVDDEKMKEKLKAIEENKKAFNQTIIEQANKGVEANTRTYQELLKPKEKKEGSPSVKIGSRKEVKLNDIMDVDKLEAHVKTREELETIWMTYHKEECTSKNTGEVENYLISGTIGAAKYRQLQANSKAYPIFLLPLPRDQGYEFFLVQFHLNEVHITSLLAYQVSVSFRRAVIY